MLRQGKSLQKRRGARGNIIKVHPEGSGLFRDFVAIVQNRRTSDKAVDKLLCFSLINVNAGMDGS